MNRPASLPPFLTWSPLGRALVFFLSAMSIWCLLAEFYGLCSMRTFTLYILIPSMLALLVMAAVDKTRGDQRLYNAILIGAIAGLIAAFSYDVFRLPFVIAAMHNSGPAWLRLPLFKVFPQFGAMIINEPFTSTQPQGQFSLWAHIIGWLYHFSNGMTFGIMFMAMVGHLGKRSWLWAIAMAVGLEIFMLATPYTKFFAIPITAIFIAVTLTAHLIFGLTLGLSSRRLQLRPIYSVS